MTAAIPATTASAAAVTTTMNVRRLPGRLARRPLPNGPDGPDGPDGPGGPGGPGGPDPTAGKGAVEGSDAYQGPDDLLPLPPESLATCSTVPTAQFRGKRSPAPRGCEPGGRQHVADQIFPAGPPARAAFPRLGGPDRTCEPRRSGRPGSATKGRVATRRVPTRTGSSSAPGTSPKAAHGGLRLP